MKHDLEHTLQLNPKLQTYVQLLTQWQPKINLVSKDSLADVWTRHIADCAQLFPYLPKTPCRLLDMGSGAGFPGLVLAILGAGDVTLVESDSRKCAFLREVSRETKTPVTILNQRLETLAPHNADVITARALASVDKLLEWGLPHCAPEGFFLFLKGQVLQDELTNALKKWHIKSRLFPSAVADGGQILCIDKAHPTL